MSRLPPEKWSSIQHAMEASGLARQHPALTISPCMQVNSLRSLLDSSISCLYAHHHESPFELLQ